MKTKTISGIKVKANVKAGGMRPNHSRSGLSVKAGVRAGGNLRPNHATKILTLS
jgi:hypothetical protein